MPHFIEATHIIRDFPDLCPYCGASGPVETIGQSVSKMSLGWLPGSVRSEVVSAMLPVCARCRAWFLRTRIAVLLLGTLALSGVLWGVLLALRFRSELPVYAVEASFVGWIALVMWRFWRRRRFRLAYFNEREAIYAATDEQYARALCEKHGLKSTKKALLVRWS